MVMASKLLTHGTDILDSFESSQGTLKFALGHLPRRRTQGEAKRDTLSTAGNTVEGLGHLGGLHHTNTGLDTHADIVLQLPGGHVGCRVGWVGGDHGLTMTLEAGLHTTRLNDTEVDYSGVKNISSMDFLSLSLGVFRGNKKHTLPVGVHLSRDGF